MMMMMMMMMMYYFLFLIHASLIGKTQKKHPGDVPPTIADLSSPPRPLTFRQ